jgi:hypothetical protein
MANRSVAVLSSSGRKLGYKTYKEAMADINAGLAIEESARCIRMLPAAEGGEFRSRRSGPYGPVVRQLERLSTEPELAVS